MLLKGNKERASALLRMNHIEPNYTPDMAQELDSAAEILADEFRIPLHTAVAICNKFRIDSRHAQWENAAPILSEIISLVILPCRNLKGRILGLVFSFGLADVANGNPELGIQSMADEGRRQGVSRALLSHYKREWDNIFGRYGRVFGKSPEACEKNRAARIRVLRKNKN